MPTPRGRLHPLRVAVLYGLAILREFRGSLFAVILFTALGTALYATTRKFLETVHRHAQRLGSDYLLAAD